MVVPAEPPNDRYLLYLHGSALNIAANITHARRFQRLGFSVLLVSYRGCDKSDGVFPSEAKIYSDARAAWSHLTEQKGRPLAGAGSLPAWHKRQVGTT